MSPAGDIRFEPLMAPVAHKLWGEPTDASKGELRWGSHGSKCVDLKKGTWFDHQDKVGGGVLDLVEKETGRKGPDRLEWLREQGFDVPDTKPPAHVNGHKAAAKAKIVATYDYLDAAGDLLFQVVRLEPKTFRQRRPDPDKSGEWIWSVKGLKLIPYRLPELQEAIASDQTVFVVEGEKDVDALWKIGVPATCNPMGAGKWTDDLTECFAGARVVILPDNDDPGRAHRDLVGKSLKPVAASVRMLDLPGLPPKGDVSDWLSRGGTDEVLYQLADRAPEWREGPAASKFGAVWFRDRHKSMPKSEWLIDDILPAQGQILLYGASQSGKSFLGVDFGLRIANGWDVFGHACKPGGVVYQAGEGGRGLVKRMKAFAIEHSLPKESDLPFVLLPTEADLYHEEGDTEDLIAEIKSLAAQMSVPLALVAVDTLATASPGANENASEDMSLIISNLKRIQEECHAAVMLVHHKNAAGERPRGHTSLFAAMDAAIEVIRDDYGNRVAKVSKQKEGEDGERLEFRLQSVTIGSDDDGKPITSCVVRPAQAGSGQTGDRNRTRLSSRGTIGLQALREAVSLHGVMAPPELLLPSSVRVAPGERWRDIFRERAFIGEDEPTEETLRKAAYRAYEDMVKAGVASGKKPWMWLTSRGERT